MAIVVLGAGSAVGDEDDEEKVDCQKNPEKCITATGKKENETQPTPNSNPTPYTGGNPPISSSSENCVGPGCVDYDISYNDFAFPICPDGYQPSPSIFDITQNPAGSKWVCTRIKSFEEVADEIADDLQATYEDICERVEAGKLGEGAIVAACGTSCSRISFKGKYLAPPLLGGCTAFCVSHAKECL